MEKLTFFSGSSNFPLAQKIFRYMGFSGDLQLVTKQFPDGEIEVKLPNSVRGHTVFVFQPTCFHLSQSFGKDQLVSPNDALMELALIARAAIDADASKVVAVVPFYGYCRQDRKDESRVPISARFVADILVDAGGINQIIMLDLHNASIQGFFPKNVKADHLYARPLFIKKFRENFDLENLVIAYPDSGARKMFLSYSELLNVRKVTIDKTRSEGDRIERDISEHEREKVRLTIEGRDVVIHDDIISTGGTIISVAKIAKECGAKDVFLSSIHGLFSNDAFQKIEKAYSEGIIKKVFVTDSINFHNRIPANFPSDVIETISLDSLFGEAITRCYRGESLSELFYEQTKYNHLNCFSQVQQNTIHEI